MRSIMNLVLCAFTVLTFASCASSSNTRSVATDDEAVEHEYRPGKKLINETNY